NLRRKSVLRHYRGNNLEAAIRDGELSAGRLNEAEVSRSCRARHVSAALSAFVVEPGCQLIWSAIAAAASVDFLRNLDRGIQVKVGVRHAGHRSRARPVSLVGLATSLALIHRGHHGSKFDSMP